MTDLQKTLIAGLTGTAFMSLYSYSLSRKEESQYREPELLESMSKQALPELKNNRSKAAFGFGLHYLSGLGFTAVYRHLWKRKVVKPNLASGAILGFFSGVFGVGVWEAIFRKHPNPPKVDKRGFYQQLLVAHTIFGAMASAQWKWLKKPH